MLASTRARVGVGVLVLLVLASIGAYAFISAQKPAAASAAAATLTIYKGTAQRAPAGSSTFSPVLSGQALIGGDQLRTGAGTASAIRFGDGSITRLDSNTAITIKALTHKGSEYQTGFFQSAGKTWNKVQRLVGVASFNVTGPNSSTAEVRGTTFVLIIEPNGDVRIDDYSGTVIFHGKAGSVTVTTGQSSTILNGTGTPQPTTGIPTADLQDPFTVFNIAADANLDATGNGDILSVNANNTIAVAETQGAFVGGGADGNSDLSFTLDWPGSTFELVIIDPDGVEYDSVVSDQHPVTYTVPKPRAGNWSYRVHDISSTKPKENWSVVVGAIRPAKQTPNLFFRGGAKQVCDHSVIGGQADSWSIRARDAAGVPTLSSSELPAYATFTDDHHGTGTFKFAPPADVPAADVAITVSSSFGGGSASLSCTEHVIPPKDASVGGQVVSGTSGVSGALVTLRAPDSSTQIAYSDGAGNFGFSGLGAGDFKLAVTVPSGYKPGGPTSQTVTLDGKTAGPPVTFTLVPFAISLASFPDGSVGDPSCSVLTLLNGVAPITWLVSSGAMPTGTGIDTYGHCNGTPTAAGTFNFTLSATDANGDTARRSYTVTIFPAPSINGPPAAPAPIDLKPWDQGFANPQTLTGTGGISPYTWSVASGGLPTGLAIGATTGTLSGAPTDPTGTYTAVIQLTDSVGAKAYRTVFVTVVRPPFISQYTTFRNGAVGDVYRSDQASSGGGVPPYTLSATGSPPGLTPSLCSVQQCEGLAVELLGTPTAGGTYKTTITLSDSVGGSATVTGTIVIAAAPLAIQPSSLPVGTLNVPYTPLILTSTGGLPPPSVPGWYNCCGLPAGLTFDRVTHTISGTPTNCGSFTPAFQVYDNSSSAYVTPVLDIGASAPTICSPATGALPSSDLGVGPYSVPLVARGGTGPYVWSMVTGSRPAGLNFAGNGTASVTLATANFVAGDINPNGTWSFSLVATDSFGKASLPVSYQLQIFPAPAAKGFAPPNGTTGVAYNSGLFFNGGGGNGCVTASETSPLPPGLYLVNYGCGQGSALQGTPTNMGTFSFTLTPIDSNGSGPPYTFSITIVDSTVVFTGATLPTGEVGGAYSRYVIATGGSIPYSYALIGGSLPAGLVLASATGVISGTPTTAGPSSVTIQATDASGTTASATFTINIDPTLTLGPPVLGAGTAGVGYSQQLAPAGGSTVNGPYTFYFAGCYNLSYSCSRSGLSLSPSGLITATKPPAMTDRFRVNVYDGDGNVAYQDYYIVFAPVPSIVTASLPNAALLSGYCQSLAANGGTPAYTWSLSSGTLPTGVVLDPYGHLTGTPTVPGTYTFTVMVTDTNQTTATQSYTVTIA